MKVTARVRTRTPATRPLGGASRVFHFLSLPHMTRRGERVGQPLVGIGVGEDRTLSLPSPIGGPWLGLCNRRSIEFIYPATRHRANPPREALVSSVNGTGNGVLHTRCWKLSNHLLRELVLELARRNRVWAKQSGRKFASQYYGGMG